MAQRQDTAGEADSVNTFNKLLILIAVIGAAVAVMAAIAAFNGGTSDGGEASAGGGGAGEAQTVQYSLTEFAIDGDLEIAPGETVFDVSNDGAIQHDLALEGGGNTPLLNAGESASLSVGNLTPGSYTIFCSVPGHREAGMERRLQVSGDASDGGGDGGGQEIDWQALDDAMTNSMLAFPAETEGVGNQLLEPTILPDGTKEFTLDVAITKWEVEPGKFVDAWTYNEMVPGPHIRVDLGDKVRVIVNNNLPMGTDVHWHGVHTPNSQDGVAPYTQDLIESGTTFTYEFTAEDRAIGMYHAHHHGQMQIPNGLFGAFTIGDIPLPSGMTVSGVEIPSDLTIDHEIPMVLNDAGVIGLSLNGKSFPATEPYVGEVGDWVVVHYYNEGLQIHPMHQHQFPQLIFAKDGIPLDQPYWSDTVNVAPGERYSVLLQLKDPGVWVWHCHILTHVERNEGMFGMVTAWIVNEA